MSQNFDASIEGQRLMYGYDNPCGGYFGTIFGTPDSDGEEVILGTIGFSRGVSLDDLVNWMVGNGYSVRQTDINNLLLQKKAEARPLSAMQKKTSNLFEGKFDFLFCDTAFLFSETDDDA